jgi:hypothetical protein
MTAIEYLIGELTKPQYAQNIPLIIEQAKEMEKMQIIDARDDLQKKCVEFANKINPHLFEFDTKESEIYYNKTYDKTNG